MRRRPRPRRLRKRRRTLSRARAPRASLPCAPREHIYFGAGDGWRCANGERALSGGEGTLWAAMEALVDEGLVKNIGVSNFEIADLKKIQAIATKPIACNQFETHPYYQRHELFEYCQSAGITVTAHSSMGGAANAMVLFEPLLKLSKVEETLVRESATRSIIAVTDVIVHPTEAQAKMASDGLTSMYSDTECFFSKLSACAITPPVYRICRAAGSPEEKLKEMRSTFAEAVVDETPMIRRAAAAAIGELERLFARLHALG